MDLLVSTLRMEWNLPGGNGTSLGGTMTRPSTADVAALRTPSRMQGLRQLMGELDAMQRGFAPPANGVAGR